MTSDDKGQRVCLNAPITIAGALAGARFTGRDVTVFACSASGSLHLGGDQVTVPWEAWPRSATADDDRIL
jgi:hypothetical protein